MTSYLPLFIKTAKNNEILVIGGGEIAAAKIEALASVDAQLEVKSKSLNNAVINLCQTHHYHYDETPYDASQLNGKRIVIAATDDNAVNEQIAADCNARGILVNVVDNPPLCDFIFPALVRRGPLQIAISSSGIAPVLARMIKQRIEQLIPTQFEKLIAFMDDKKASLRSHFTKLQPRRLFCEDVLNGAIAEEVLEGNANRADALFAQALKDNENAHQAALYLVGAGPGHEELITLKAIRLISKADIILYDRLTAPSLLDKYARKDAEKILVGKTRDLHHKTQEEIDQLIEAHLLKGHVLVRLKGGDPGIYAHGAEEIAIAKRVGAPYQIVPGISAANGCAAYSGIPLTERGGAASVRYLTLYKKHLLDDSFWQSMSHSTDETLVFYMSSHHYSALCSRLVGSGFATSTPFLIIEQGTTPQQAEFGGELGEFDARYKNKKFASPCLMIVGDVTRWHAANAWKEQPQQAADFFPPLPLKGVGHA